MSGVQKFQVDFLPWQGEVWNSEAKEIIVAAGRRVGKTEFAAYRMLINGMNDGITDLDAARFYVAPTQAQARDVFWPKLHQLGAGLIKASHINNMQVTLINDQVISLKGADRPETMRGVKLADLVLDEYADMKPYVLEEILIPALSDYQSGYLMIGTPAGRNHFYNEYVDALHGDDPNRAAFTYTTYDNPHIARDLLAYRKATMSSFAFRQEYMASFEARGSEMFQESWVKTGKERFASGMWYIAVDLAGFEEAGRKKGGKGNLDDTAIAIVQVSKDGWWVEEIITGRWTLDETADKIFRAVEKYKPVKVGIERGIAKQAVMSPLMHLMHQRQRHFAVQELTHGNQKKTDRIAWALQGRFENGNITINKEMENLPKFLDQLYQFPDRLTHDDMVDALSYIDQLALSDPGTSFSTEADWEVIDEMAGW